MNKKFILCIMVLSLMVVSGSEQAYTYDKYAAIKAIYPDITDNDFIVRDDGSGQFVSSWTYYLPQPSESDMIKAYDKLKLEKDAIDKMGKQDKIDKGYEGLIKAPVVTKLDKDYPFSGIVMYNNILYYKGTDGWHRMDGSLV